MTNVESTTNIPALLTPSSLTDDCIICYEPLNQESGCVTTKCGHKYCPACFVTHMNIDNKCAMCRTEIPMKKPMSMDTEFNNQVRSIDEPVWNRIRVPAFPQRFPIQEVLNTNRGSGRVPFSVPMSVMIREEQMRREREELVRNGRTGGHWGVPWNPEGEEEIIT
jgi:hypothetical protein